MGSNDIMITPMTLVHSILVILSWSPIPIFQKNQPTVVFSPGCTGCLDLQISNRRNCFSHANYE